QKSGWARVENIGGSLGGVATFQHPTQGIAGVIASQLVNVATIPVDNSAAENRFTGYAVANLSDNPIMVKLVTVNADGSIADASVNVAELNPLAANRQTAKFLHQDAGSRTTFRGSMVLIGQGGAQFAVVALVLNQNLLTAIPVIPEKAPSIN